MSTSPTPAIGRLNTPPAIQGSVIALRTAGKSKRSIAKELGIARDTVDNILEAFQTDQPNYATTVRELTTKAFVRVSTAIENEKDTDTARWALERTVFQPSQTEPTVYRDQSLNIAVGFVPSGTSTPSQPMSTSSTSPTEAPAKPTPSSIGLSSQTNFSAFSDADLEQELARRRAERSGVIEAEVVP